MKQIEFKPTNYQSDLTDAQWELIKAYLPQDENSTHHKRPLVNAALYLLSNGIKWRSMPHGYPPWPTAHSFYFRARASGLWQKIQEAMLKKSG